MKVLNNNSFYVVPRLYPLLTDEVSLSLRKEMTEAVISPNFTFELSDKMKITITDVVNFEVGDKYEIEIKNGLETIYLGKLLIVSEGTDVQNYEYTTQNGRFTY